MSKSIGSRYHGQQFNHTDMCDYCGCHWQRTDMVLDADQLLRCPECDPHGRAYVTLAEESAAAVGEIEPMRGKTREMP
jgi:hypothetical protein